MVTPSVAADDAGVFGACAATTIVALTTASADKVMTWVVFMLGSSNPV
jgi:hypothetical protein